jgi:CheY-like chemotaxis protein
MQLRQIERFAHLPIIVVSTRERAEDRLRACARADAYLTRAWWRPIWSRPSAA